MSGEEPINVDPESLHRGASALEQFAQVLQPLGERLKATGQKVLAAARSDGESGVGKAVEEGTGAGVETVGTVFDEAGRVVGTAGRNLHTHAENYRGVDDAAASAYRNVHQSMDGDSTTPTIARGGSSAPEDDVPASAPASGPTAAPTIGSSAGSSGDYSGNPAFRSSADDRQNFAAAYHGYADDEQFVQDLKARDPSLAGIPTEDLVAVRGYTGDEFYSQMNSALRSGDPAALAQYDAHIRATTSGLNQLPPTTGEYYRGMQIPSGNVSDVLSKYEPGQVVTEPHFLSTGEPFPGNVQYVVQSTTGRDVSSLSHYPHESEVLFPPGSRFQVESKIEVSPGHWVIKMSDVG